MEKLLATAIQLPVSSSILVLTLGASIAGLWWGSLIDKGALVPHRWFQERRFWTLLSSGFLHATWVHLAVNLFAFYIFAFSLEHYLLRKEVYAIPDTGYGQGFAETIAHLKLLLLYLGSMIGADLPALFRYRKDPSYSSVGASGAISGLLMAYIVHIYGGFSFTLFGLPLWLVALIFLAGSSVVRRIRPNPQVAHDSHIWGAMAGLLLTFVLYPSVTWDFFQRLVQDIVGFF